MTFRKPRPEQDGKRPEFAWFPDGTVCVGFSNQDDAGGFTVVADITENIFRYRNEILEAAARMCHNHSWSRDVEWWMSTSKKDATAETARECATAIRAMKKERECV